VTASHAAQPVAAIATHFRGRGGRRGLGLRGTGGSRLGGHRLRRGLLGLGRSAAAGAGLPGRLAPLALCCASRVSASLTLASACGSAAGPDLDLVAFLAVGIVLNSPGKPILLAISLEGICT
jgi:hypothetical protein